MSRVFHLRGGGVLDCDADAMLDGEVLHNLVYLIAVVPPGDKLDSTAPYASSSLVLLETSTAEPGSSVPRAMP